MRQIKVFDTTLRDGEQAPGCSMDIREKIEVARQLERLRVDVIEAGFAISSPGDFESVSLAHDTHLYLYIPRAHGQQAEDGPGKGAGASGGNGGLRPKEVP